jgi:membrane-bound ClpP family serine protease
MREEIIPGRFLPIQRLSAPAFGVAGFNAVVEHIPGKKHLQGVSEEEQRQYEHIVEEAKKAGRYRGREKEVAARTVLKSHKKKGHKKGE